MNKIYFFFLTMLLCSSIFGQQPNIFKVPTPSDQKIINGYTVRIIIAMPNGYGFDIMQNNKPLVHQVQNPIPFAPKGIQEKEDAFKIAEWLIKDYQEHSHWRNTIPPHVARELKIKIH